MTIGGLLAILAVMAMLAPPLAAQGSADTLPPAAGSGPAVSGADSADADLLSRGLDGGDATFDPATGYPDWERLASRAEAAIEAGRATDKAFETLRGDLVIWRATFQDAQTANQSRIDTLKAQIAALGPAPEGTDTESAEIAARRDQLNRQLARLEAPRRAADEAYSRADSLIREIDTLIRDRQTDQLLQLGPSPLNPMHWAGAISELGTTAGLLLREVRALWATPTILAKVRDRLPVTLFLIVLAAILLLRGRGWLYRLEERLLAGRSQQAGGVIEFLTSLARAAVVYLGFLLLQTAIDTGHLAGHRGQVLSGELARLGLLIALGVWVGTHIFPAREAGNEVLKLPPDQRARGRASAIILGATIWLMILIGKIAEFENYSDATRAVLQFPVLVIAGLCLAEIGRLIGYRPPPADGEMAVGDFRRKLARSTGRFVVVFGILGPILAAIGYQSAASFLTFPAALSLALISVLVLLQRFFTQLYGLIARKSDSDLQELLMPVLIGIVLTLVSMPVFALIWGARVADLTELWTQVKGGFLLGDTRVSPAMFLTFALVFGAGFGLTRVVQGTLRTVVLPKTAIDHGGRNAIVAGIGYTGIFLSALLAITSTGISLTSLAFVAGALSLGIGFGLQNIVSNFVAGIIMLIERPVAEGDWIEVGGKQGIVKAISVRSTRIETFDRNSVIVPNADFINSTVTNWTRGNLTGRIMVPIGVAYGTDTRHVEAILREIVEAHPLVTLNPAPSVSFENFGADALEFVIRAILRDINFGLAVRSEIRHQIAERFAAEGIEIPFGQRDIWLRNPETLAGAFSQGAGKAGGQDAADADPDRPARRRRAARKAQQAELARNDSKAAPGPVGSADAVAPAPDVAQNPADGQNDEDDD